MIVAVADSHAAVWYLRADPRLSRAAKLVFDSAEAQAKQIGISSISLVEVVYLEERNRVPAGTLALLFTELNLPGGLFTEVPVERRVVQRLPEVPRAEVADMPDRIIAATALHLGVPVISRDGKILTSSVPTIW